MGQQGRDMKKDEVIITEADSPSRDGELKITKSKGEESMKTKCKEYARLSMLGESILS